MLAYIVRRCLAIVPVLIGVSMVVFLFLHLLPGDPATTMLGERATEESLARVRAQYGLDQPLPVQYLRFVARVARGDLGRSLRTNNPVLDEFQSRFPATVELSLAAMLIAVVVGVPVGILSATRRGSLIDSISMVGALAGVSMPIFFLGLLLIWLFAVVLRWLPPSGRLDTGMRIDPVTNLLVLDSLLRGNWPALSSSVRHLLLPAVALATIPMAVIARMTRSAMLEVLGQDYVRTARAKGLRDRTVVFRHALKNAALPVVTVIGLQVGLLLSGAVLTESIFAWPGIGRWLFDSILLRDYPVVQGLTLVIALIFVVANLLVDLSYAVLDPRTRYR